MSDLVGAISDALSGWTCSDDKTCQDNIVYGALSCCYYAEVIDASAADSTWTPSYAALGWPIADGESSDFCLDAVSWGVNSLAEDQEFTETWTGIKYKGYCNGAAKVAVAVSAVATAAFAAAF